MRAHDQNTALVSRCKLCHAEQEIAEYVFCNDICQYLYWYYLEAKMQSHTFTQGNTPGKCSICGRDYLAHSNFAKCDTCGNIGPCDITDGKLLCVSCTGILLEQRREQISVNVEHHKDIIEKAREIDRITVSNFHQNFWNAETIAIEELRKAVMSDNSLDDIAKEYRIQELIAERVLSYQAVVNKQQEELYASMSQLGSAQHALREYGSKLRKDIREKIALNDLKYPVKPVKPTVTKKEYRTPYQQMIDKLAKNLNCSYEEAEARMKSGKLNYTDKTDKKDDDGLAPVINK